MADNLINFHIVYDDKGAIVGLKSTAKGFKDLDLTVKNAEQSQQQLNNAINKMGGASVKSIKLTQKEYEKLIKTQEQAKNATGGATSAAMELGRVISDAPYGIRGMANNITQLVSQLGFAAKATGSWTTAIKGMFGALTGPLGIVFAITAVVSALDWFSGTQKKVKKETDKTTKAIKKQISALEELSLLKGAISGLLFTNSDNAALDKYNKGLLTLEETVKIISRNYSEFSNAYEKLTESQKKDEGNVKALLDGYIELLSLKEKEKKQIKEMQSLREAIDKQDKSAALRKKQGYKDALTFISAEERQLANLESDYIKTQKRLVKLEAFFKKKEKGSSAKKKEGEIKEPISKLQERLNKEAETTREHLQKLVLMQEENQVKKAKLKVQFDIENAEREKEIALKEFEFLADKYNKELELYLNQQVKLGKITREQADKRLQEEANKSSQMLNQLRQIYEARISYLKSVGQKEISQAVNKEALKSSKQIQEIQKYLDKKVQLHEKELQLDTSFYDKQKAMADTAKKIADAKAQSLQTYLESFSSVLGSVGSFLQAEADREVAIEENKNNALNEQLNNRLLNENLSAKERKNIQNEIARNDEENRKKQNEIKKKAFNTQKAFNISMGIANTVAAALSAANQTFGGPIARIAAMTAVITSGLANVAIIARQKFQPEAASTPIRTASGGAGGGGVGNRSFDFNLVGSSQGNQVAEAVQGQFDKPIKAYVVSKDITNQQQLDANTKSSARFGG